MKTRNALLGLVAVAALATAPLADANARGWDHHGGWGRGGGWGHERGFDRGGFRGGAGEGLFFGLLGATAALVTAPFALAGAIVAPGPVYAEPSYPAQGYAPAPVYAAPAPVYGYAPAPYGYYRPHRVVYAAPAPVYGYPAPVYGAYPGY